MGSIVVLYVWPSDAVRFVLPVFPFLLGYGVLLARRWRTGAVAYATFFVALGVVAIALSTRLTFSDRAFPERYASGVLAPTYRVAWGFPESGDRALVYRPAVIVLRWFDPVASLAPRNVGSGSVNDLDEALDARLISPRGDDPARTLAEPPSKRRVTGERGEGVRGGGDIAGRHEVAVLTVAEEEVRSCADAIGEDKWKTGGRSLVDDDAPGFARRKQRREGVARNVRLGDSLPRQRAGEDRPDAERVCQLLESPQLVAGTY